MGGGTCRLWFKREKKEKKKRAFSAITVNEYKPGNFLTLQFTILEGLILIMWGISGDLDLEPWKSILSRRTKHFLAVLFQFCKGLFYILKRSYIFIPVIINYDHSIALSEKYKNLKNHLCKKEQGCFCKAPALLTVSSVVDGKLAFWILDSAALFSCPVALTWSGRACTLPRTEENLAHSFEKGYI